MWQSDYSGTYDSEKSSKAEDTLFHELGHAWTSGHPLLHGNRGNVSKLEELWCMAKVTAGLATDTLGGDKTGKTYSSSTAGEYLTAAVMGFDTLRNVTGRKMTTPEEMHRALDEMEKDPKILDQFPSEGGRIFRDYLLPQRAESPAIYGGDG